MNPSYKTSAIFNGQKIIPSDIFNLNNNTYMLLDILENPLSDTWLLHIVGVEGEHAGKEFTFPLSELATLTSSDLQKN